MGGSKSFRYAQGNPYAGTKRVARSRPGAIPEYQWVASGVGDFTTGTTLIEVKCTNKHFSSSDYRQMLMYWLLSYCSAIEHGKLEWVRGILINPRLNLVIDFSFDEIIAITAGSKSKIELVESFSALLLDDRAIHPVT